MDAKGRRVPENKRELFKRPLGSDITEEGLKKLDGKQMLITVGDVVSLVVRERGIRPDLSIYDGMTERREMTAFASLVKDRGWKEIVAKNEAGTVSAELFAAVREALEGRTGIIRVEGEEDLAVMPCILCAPVGTHVIYGWPGVGMKLITVDEETRKEIKLLMNQMEELE